MADLVRDGVRIHYEISGERNDRLPVLLSHGFGATSLMWAPNLPALAAARTIITWDMRGHGRSDSPASGYTRQACVQDMAAVLDAAEVGRAVVGGLSLGGNLSLAFRLAHAERVAALMLFDTGPGFRSEQARQRWNDQALATLADFGDAPTEATLVTAARLLAKAPVTVLFAQVPLVAKLLHQAESLGKDSAELVLQALLTTNGVITKWVGDPSEKDKQELQQARRIIENLPRGSIERRFFEQLAHRIEVELSWTMEPSLPRDDGREW